MMARGPTTPTKAKAKGKATAGSPKPSLSGAGGVVSRHVDRRTADAQALRALTKRFPTATMALLTEKVGASGVTWQVLVRNEFLAEGKKETRIREAKWRELSRIYKGLSDGGSPKQSPEEVPSLDCT